MSGHFVLQNITDQEIEDIQNAWLQDKLTVPVLGPVQHGNIGWNGASRAQLVQAMGAGVPNRAGLPPHKYLDFGVEQIGPKGQLYLFECYQSNGWIRRIVRPDMGLTALSTDAQEQWTLGRLRESFINQLTDNGATLEIYYLNNGEIQ
ncbi:hypothetical protein VINI7043_14355 [Vibrio nigripulchritudo ATCC 27043]|uniref:hypothetical protein n=1 Tax=Vibrio nigripulchritudo TaxID=28173 RepID=UPI00021C30D4|nr:hypothetical protein [Vibrio nigripulchritudo]EGU61394.1 hypothetical protein VINI7043_14355 [Vibrio nigripulchritudo ATCC 27043]